MSRRWGTSRRLPGRGEVVRGSIKDGWEFIKPIPYKSLVISGIYGDSYKMFNVGYDIFQFQGYSAHTPKYGGSGPKFSSIQEVFRVYGVSSLSKLEEKQGVLEYGHGIYMCGDFRLSGEGIGCYYYISDGRWCRGSGAEPLTFWEIRKV